MHRNYSLDLDNSHIKSTFSQISEAFYFLFDKIVTGCFELFYFFFVYQVLIFQFEHHAPRNKLVCSLAGKSKTLTDFVNKSHFRKSFIQFVYLAEM